MPEPDAVQRRDRRRLRGAGRPVRAGRSDRPPRACLQVGGQGGSRTRRCPWPRSRARAARRSCPGSATRCRRRSCRSSAAGSIPAAERLRAKFPPGLDRDHAPARHRRQAGAAAALRAGGRLAAGAARGGARAAHPHRPRARAQARGARAGGARADRRGPRGNGLAARAAATRAWQLGEELVTGLRALAGDGAHIELAGSLRRQVDAVKDIDVIAATTRPTTLAKSLGRARADRARELCWQGGREGAHALRHGRRPAHRRPPRSWATCFSTSPALARTTRRCARRRCAAACTCPSTASSTTPPAPRDTYASEQEVYERLGLAYIEPELRENRGELEAARAGELPRLIELADIRGDLHSHTIASDGHNTIEEMALAARERGYEYLAITDHSASHGFGNDVSPEQLRRQIELVREANDARRGDRAAGGQRGQHPARRLARLRGRAAARARLDRGERAHVLRHGRAGDDRAHDRRDRAPAGATRSAIRPVA